MDNDVYFNMSDAELSSLFDGFELNKKDSNSDKINCVNCKSSKLIFDSIKNYMICEDCAVINNEYFDYNPDMFIDNENNETSSYGAPSNIHFPISSLGTKIYSKKFSSLCIYQTRSQMPYKEKSLMGAFINEIQEKCEKNGIKKKAIIETAKILYKKITEAVHTKGKRKGKNIIMRCKNRRSMIAACIFHACKLQKEPRSPKEIADMYQLEIKDVNRGCRKFCDIIDKATLFNQIKNSEATDFIERYAKELNIDMKYIEKAKDVANNIKNFKFASTHEPPSLAAGCLLLVAKYYNISLNKKDISKIFGISDVTISKTYRKIGPYHKIVTNNLLTKMIVDKLNNVKPSDNSNEKLSNTFIKSNIISENSDEELTVSNHNETEEKESEKPIKQKRKYVKKAKPLTA
jgi:transcription initiation factor TFIIIB Brf1 subunit/transcription initiation factor TFIIB